MKKISSEGILLKLKIEIGNIFLYSFFRRLISRDAMLFSLRADKNLGLDARRFSLTMKGPVAYSVTGLSRRYRRFNAN